METGLAYMIFLKHGIYFYLSTLTLTFSFQSPIEYRPRLTKCQ